MKVGDLVRLSAYGKKLKRTGWISHDDVGIITRINTWDEHQVRWVKSDWNLVRSRWVYERFVSRKDLKFVK